MRLFRTLEELTEEEVQQFKGWARQNYRIFHEIKGIWHPIVQRECVLMNEEVGYVDHTTPILTPTDIASYVIADPDNHNTDKANDMANDSDTTDEEE